MGAVSSGAYAVPPLARALRLWCEEHEVTLSQRLMLRAILEGAERSDLSDELGLSPMEAAYCEVEMTYSVGRTPAEVVKEIVNLATELAAVNARQA